MGFLLSIFLAIIILLFGSFLSFFFLFCILPVLRGAPFVPIHKERLARAIELVKLGPGQKTVDLGSGDGRILIAVAKKGAQAYGFELNPFLVLRAKRKIKKEGLQNLAFCQWRSFWSQDLSSFDVVFIYGISHIMKWLEKKLQRELKPGAKVVAFIFPLPHWKVKEQENGIYIYVVREQLHAEMH